MSITQDDFKKIWASTSSVPEYTFSDSDYQDGWEFVGNLPPTRAMWDTLQRRNDQKMKYLQDKGLMCFDSVADMVASNLEAGQTVITKGYYSVNDGGNGVYTIRTKTQSDVDDGGSIIFLDNGNVAELITDGTVNVKQFGAKGDGVADDTAAIQNAIDFGKNIFFDKGTYLVSLNDSKNALEMVSNINVDFNNSTLKLAANSSHEYAILMFDGVSNINIKNLNVVGDKDIHTGSTGEWGMGLHLRGNTSNVVVENVSVSKCWGDGFYHGVYNGSSPHNIIYKNIRGDYNRRGGFTVTSGYDIHVTTGVFTHTDGTAPQAGFTIEPNSDSEKVIVYVDDIVCSDNTGYGFECINPRIGNVELYAGKIECLNNIPRFELGYLSSSITPVRGIIDVDSVTVVLDDNNKTYEGMVIMECYNSQLRNIHVGSFTFINNLSTNMPYVFNVVAYGFNCFFDSVIVKGNYDAIININDPRQRILIGTLYNYGAITATAIDSTAIKIGEVISPVVTLTSNTTAKAFVRDFNCSGTFTLTFDVKGFVDGQKVMLTNGSSGTITVSLPTRIHLMGSNTNVTSYTIPPYSMSEIMYIGDIGGFFTEVAKYTS